MVKRQPQNEPDEQGRKWMIADEELSDLLFSTRGGRSEPRKHELIQTRMSKLLHTLSGPGGNMKETTRCGKHRLPVTKGSHGTYSVLNRSEALGAIWYGMGFDTEDTRHLNLPRDAETGKLYVHLHRFDLSAGKVRGNPEMSDAIKAYFWKEVGEPADDKVLALSVRLYCNGSEGDVEPQGEHTEVMSTATHVLCVKDLICDIEKQRIDFGEKCNEAWPLLSDALNKFRTDASDDEDEDEGCVGVGSKSNKKQRTDTDPDQGFDLFFNKLSSAKGTKDSRKNMFKGDAGPHIAELFYVINQDLSLGMTRMAKVVAPTYSDGAELQYTGCIVDGEQKGGYKFRKPSVNPESSTIITAKIFSMPPAEREELTEAYLGVQDAAHSINYATGQLVKYIHRTFSLSLCLEMESGKRAQFAYCDTLPKELVLLQVYLDAVFTPRLVDDEDDEDDDEESGGEGSDSSSEGSDPEDSDYKEGDTEKPNTAPTSSEDDDDDDDDDDSNASDASDASDGDDESYASGDNDSGSS